MGLKRTGQWTEARGLLESLSKNVGRHIQTAVRQEAQGARRAMIQGLKKQSPGGKNLQKIADSTRKIRSSQGFKGRKALLRSGDLRNSIGVIARGNGAFVGVLRSAKTRDGRSLVNVARVQEEGRTRIQINMTPRMRAFLAIKLKDKRKRKTRGGGVTLVVVQIPPRPFIRPVFDELFGRPAETRRRFSKRLARLTKGRIGSV